MPMSSKESIAIKVEGLCKAYQIKGKRGQNTQIRALDNVSIDFPKGEITGIIGANGSGKSSLLKIMSEITAPDKGKIDIEGKLISILEIGTGFHPDLSGRKNIYFNARLHGMNTKDVNEKMDQIIDFFGFPDFLDTPVKHYSSGMYMRLAFSIVIHMQADIYLFDEVMSVGDIEFQQAAIERIKQLKHKGKTILIVTHAPSMIADISDRMILLNQGNVEMQGNPVEIIYHYNKKHLKLNSNQFTCNESKLLQSLHKLIPIDIDFEAKSAKIIQDELVDTINYSKNWKIQFQLQSNSTKKIRIGVYFIEAQLKQTIFSTESEDFIPSNQTQALNIEIEADTFNVFSGNIGFYIAKGKDVIWNYPDILTISGEREDIFREYHALRGYLTPKLTLNID